MSQTLYRKYRSQRFSELVGQEAVTRILRNSIARGRLNHAYLFSGPRGTGKTSVARIFAKALNCRAPRDGDACGECEVCRGVADGSAADVIEIDAASNRGVNEIKDALIDRVGYAPLVFKYKVYIIDEVHMLSSTAFNSMLKTLEEPPGHVVFCLCTTEAHKLPITILSRCIRFDFHLLPLDKLADHLTWIAGEEGFSLAADAAAELARLSEGSARDAISLLDQLLVYCDQEITAQAIQELFQLGDPTLAPRVVDALAAGDPLPVLETWETLLRQGADAGQFMLKVADELKARYLATGETGWRRALEAIWQGVNLLKFESFPAVLVELTLLNAQAALATPVSQPAAAAPPQRPAPARTQPAAPARGGDPDPRILAKPVVDLPAAKPPAQPSAPAPAVAPPSAPPGPVAAERQTGPVARMTAEWEQYLAALKAHRLTTYALLFRDVFGELKGNVLTIEFAAGAEAAYKYAQMEEHAPHLVAVAEKVNKQPTGVILRLEGRPGAEAVLKDLTRPEPKQDEPPPEITMDVVAEYEVVDEGPAGGAAGVDPDRLAQSAERMESELSTELNPVAEDADERPTAGFVQSLFDAEELTEEE
ncbi:DNA polymerase III subunit gamma/tau [bacterium]|nr:DNA polymerase III subunit gamma/tau [bacterium]